MDEHWLPAHRRFRFPGTLWTKWFLPSILLCDSFGRIDGFLPVAILIFIEISVGMKMQRFHNSIESVPAHGFVHCLVPQVLPFRPEHWLLESLLYPDTVSIPRNTVIISSLMLWSGQFFETLYNLLCSTICLKIWSSRNNSNSSTESKLAHLSYCTSGKASGEGIWDSQSISNSLSLKLGYSFF